MSILEKYQLEAEEDLLVDEVTIQEKAMKVPAIKHKWVTRLITSKQELNKLEEMRRKSVRLIVEKLKQNQKVTLSDVALTNSAYKHDTVVKIGQKVEEYKLIIEYLERLEKIMASMTWDYKNMTDLIKMETL